MAMAMRVRTPLTAAAGRVVTTAALRPAFKCSAARPVAPQPVFLRPRCGLQSLCSSFKGLRLISSPLQQPAGPARRGLAVVAKGGNCMGNTKGGTRRSRTRTSGFRTRRLTVGGRHVLRNRRIKGRKVLAPGNYKKGSPGKPK